MKTLHALGMTALLTITLTSCSADQAGPPTIPTVAPTAVVTYAAPLTLKQADDEAMDPSIEKPAMVVMTQLRGLAETQVKPYISSDDWSTAELVYLKAANAVLTDQLTERELKTENVRYASLIRGFAREAGVSGY